MKIRVKSFAEVSTQAISENYENGFYNEKNWPFDGTEVVEARVNDSGPWAPGYYSDEYGIFMENEVEVVPE